LFSNVLLQNTGLIYNIIKYSTKNAVENKRSAAARSGSISSTFFGVQNETYSQCTRYDVDWMTMENFSVVATYLPVPNASWSVVPCDHGWEYETSEMTSSIVIDVRSFV